MSEITAEGVPKRRRVSAAVRKELLLETALRLAREGGAGSLTLARLADACGVSKPITLSAPWRTAPSTPTSPPPSSPRANPPPSTSTTPNAMADS